MARGAGIPKLVFLGGEDISRETEIEIELLGKKKKKNKKNKKKKKKEKKKEKEERKKEQEGGKKGISRIFHKNRKSWK